MRKYIIALLAVILILALNACSEPVSEHPQNQNYTAETQLNTETAETLTTTCPTDATYTPLSGKDIIDRLNQHAYEIGLAKDCVTNIETSSGKNPQETEISFTYYGGLARASVTEYNGIAHTIMVATFFSNHSIIDPNFTTTESTQSAFLAVHILLDVIELDKDAQWHAEQQECVPNEGDDNVLINTYNSDEWNYIFVGSTDYISYVVTKHCKQCNENAPNVMFTSDTGICDKCYYPAQGLPIPNTTEPVEVTEPSSTFVNPICARCGKSWPEVPFLVDWKEGGFCYDCSVEAEEETQAPPSYTNSVPYYASISASVGIYQSPSFYSAFVQYVGADGIYTIMEEAYDSEGNLWGRLKSGLGWVMLSATTNSSRVCPQCGKSEPNAIFNEDWKPGDLCFGCNYDNGHGGADGKMYCSQCGADCTYRGLEPDGRCEDCHNGN